MNKGKVCRACGVACAGLISLATRLAVCRYCGSNQRGHSHMGRMVRGH